jgi:hypothetical protein
LFNEPKCLRLYDSDCECEAQTINHSSSVDGSGVAAENEYSTQNRIYRQNPAVECNNNLENGTICLSSETNPKNLADLFSIDSGSEILEKFFNQVFLSEVVCFESKLPVINLLDPNNLNSFAHAPTVGAESRELVFKHDGNVIYVGMKKLKFGQFSQFDYLSLEFNRTSKQESELLLNCGRFFYTKSGLFGINVSYSFQFGSEVFELAPAAKTPGGQIKSIFHTIEHPAVRDGQRSPSSSEDG